MRAQVEASFSWVFVLIAGVAFLLLFFGLIRSCTQTGITTINSANVHDATSQLSAFAWEGNAQVNITLPQANVVCPAGSFALMTKDGSLAPIDRAPVYLPPLVGGRATLVARELSIAPGPSPFAFGNAVYVLDERTVYVIIQDLGGLADRLVQKLPEHPSLRDITLADIERPENIAKIIPASAKTVVFVTVGNEVDLARLNVSEAPPGVDIRGVALEPLTRHGGRATFFQKNTDGTLVAVSRIPYAHELVGLGMIVSADPDLVRCSTTEVSKRARTIVTVAANRATVISPVVADLECQIALNDAATLLSNVVSTNGDAAFLDAFIASETQLLSIQGTLLSRPGGCPGVA